MSSRLVEIITAPDPAARNRALDDICAPLTLDELLAECAALEQFRRSRTNLYERVRALFFLYSLHRFHLPLRAGLRGLGMVPFRGYTHLLQRRFEEAIDTFLSVQSAEGPSDALSSALAAAYHRLGFQTLADQVRRSVRSVRGNQWMFRMGHPADHPLRLRPELLDRSGPGGPYPILRERTPVRMDLTHSAWSDIFFLGMDYPEGARVLNVSIDLGVHGRDAFPRPPIEAALRVIDEPVLRLISVDLGASADVAELAEIFDFARDYLGLLKAAVIAAGIVPPGIEGSGQSLADLLARVVGPGRGLEIASTVNDIPKGSRLAVSTNLLAALISVCMRATGQTRALTGTLDESERRVVAARAILGEWIGGSGGGWQDSGGVWPGIKLIQGEPAAEGDPEFGISRGRLLPSHTLLTDLTASVRDRLQESLVLVHGGMAQNVGPILEMVTEKYLLRSPAEWESRGRTLAILQEILRALESGDTAAIGAATTRNFQGPIQTIIPWATNLYTETLIRRVREEFGDDFHGFWMLGGMSGGGMGFIFNPRRKAEAQERLAAIMTLTKRELEDALPFAMHPVVYDFAINTDGTKADLLTGGDALMPPGYYALTVPQLLRRDARSLDPARREELVRFGAACHNQPGYQGMVAELVDRLLPGTGEPTGTTGPSLDRLLAENGFDREQHEAIRTALRAGRIGLAQNRLPVNADIQDVNPSDLVRADSATDADRQRGLDALAAGSVAVLSLAAGAGSRWTQGAGVVKALHPFCKLGGAHRSFLEVHLAKSRRISRLAGEWIPHLFSTSHLTHAAIDRWLTRHNRLGYEGPIHLSPGRAIGLRMVPMVRDLQFAWEEMPQQMLDERAQKMRDSLHGALIEWARSAGEGSDYTDNLPGQCLHPVGHWYELPNLLRNGLLRSLLTERPGLKTLLLHNIDTLGADADPALLGLHLRTGACLSFEVIPRRIEDRGGGLARVDGKVRLVEGLAMPREEDEFALSYYNSMTTWIDIDRLLAAFGLDKDRLDDEACVAAAIRTLAARMPTYVTLKEVKKRWGHGQEDIFPVAQFEKLWSDMSAIGDLDCAYLAVPRMRGQQLKDQAQLDGM